MESQHHETQPYGFGTTRVKLFLAVLSPLWKKRGAARCVVDEKLETYSCFEWQGQDTGSRGFECTATGGKVSYQTCDRSKAARGCKQETAASIDGKTYRETYVYWWGRDSQISCLGEELTTDGQPLALSKKHAPKASS
jgi:hypothetical protein